MAYSLNDISVIIPTYNRSAEIQETLNEIVKHPIKEILLIDQSTNIEEANQIKTICDSYKTSICPPKYYHFDFASTAKARNKGIELSNNQSKIICFIDDDVSIANNYFQIIIQKFNNNPNTQGVAAYNQLSTVSKNTYLIDLFLGSIFFLRNYDKDKCRMVSPYGNIYPYNLNKDIYAEWFPGFNTAYKKEIFTTIQFNDNLGGYSLAEDTDVSYGLFLKNPKALILTTDTIVKHRYSAIERIDHKKLSYINQIDHFYIYWKYNESFNKIKFYWSLFGILIFRTISLLNFKSKSIIKWRYFIKSWLYCIKNKKQIMNGEMRNFII